MDLGAKFKMKTKDVSKTQGSVWRTDVEIPSVW